MDESKKEPTNTPPYVAYKTFKNFLRSLSQAMPRRIDKSVMTSYSGGAQSQLIQALKYLNLINANGIPTDKLAPLVKAEGPVYSKALHEVLTASYPFIKEDELATSTQKQLEEAFSTVANGDTVRKCISFYVPAAKDAGLKVSPFIKELGKRTPSNGKPKKARATTKHHPSTPEATAPIQSQPHSPVMSWHEMLLSKFPSFDPSWPDDVKKKWFDSFADLMQRGQEKKGGQL